MYITSKQRFVREYANWKIAKLEDLTKSFPDKKALHIANAILIREWLKGWERSLITTDEIMAKIAEL